MAIKNLPAAVRSNDGFDNNVNPSLIVPIRTLGTSVATHDESVSSSTATAITFNTETTSLRIIARDYEVYVKVLTEADMDACTVSNKDECIPAGMKEDFAIKSDCVGVSLLGKSGTSIVTIIEY